MINLIEENDVTYVTLSLELERASIMYETHEEGQSLYVTEDNFPFWIRIRKNSGLIGLGTYIKFRSSTTELQKLTLANHSIAAHSELQPTKMVMN